jgi:hypothetical protein
MSVESRYQSDFARGAAYLPLVLRKYGSDQMLIGQLYVAAVGTAWSLTGSVIAL